MQTTHYLNSGLISLNRVRSNEIKENTKKFLLSGGKIKEFPPQESIPNRPARVHTPLV